MAESKYKAALGGGKYKAALSSKYGAALEPAEEPSALPLVENKITRAADLKTSAKAAQKEALFTEEDVQRTRKLIEAQRDVASPQMVKDTKGQLRSIHKNIRETARDARKVTKEPAPSVGSIASGVFSPIVDLTNAVAHVGRAATTPGYDFSGAYERTKGPVGSDFWDEQLTAEQKQRDINKAMRGGRAQQGDIGLGDIRDAIGAAFGTLPGAAKGAVRSVYDNTFGAASRGKYIDDPANPGQSKINSGYTYGDFGRDVEGAQKFAGRVGVQALVDPSTYASPVLQGGAKLLRKGLDIALPLEDVRRMSGIPNAANLSGALKSREGIQDAYRQARAARESMRPMLGEEAGRHAKEGLESRLQDMFVPEPTLEQQLARSVDLAKSAPKGQANAAFAKARAEPKPTMPPYAQQAIDAMDTKPGRIPGISDVQDYRRAAQLDLSPRYALNNLAGDASMALSRGWNPLNSAAPKDIAPEILDGLFRQNVPISQAERVGASGPSNFAPVKAARKVNDARETAQKRAFFNDLLKREMEKGTPLEEAANIAGREVTRGLVDYGNALGPVNNAIQQAKGVFPYIGYWGRAPFVGLENILRNPGRNALAGSVFREAQKGASIPDYAQSQDQYVPVDMQAMAPALSKYPGAEGVAPGQWALRGHSPLVEPFAAPLGVANDPKNLLGLMDPAFGSVSALSSGQGFAGPVTGKDVAKQFIGSFIPDVLKPGLEEALYRAGGMQNRTDFGALLDPNAAQRMQSNPFPLQGRDPITGDPDALRANAMTSAGTGGQLKFFPAIAPAAEGAYGPATEDFKEQKKEAKRRKRQK